MGEPIPGKGALLTQIGAVLVRQLGHIVPQPSDRRRPESVVAPGEVARCRGRSIWSSDLKPLPVEAVVRGYLAGSAGRNTSTTARSVVYACPPV